MKNRISGEITFDSVLIDFVRKYKWCNRLILGVKSDKQPPPIDVQKIVLILVCVQLLGYCAVVDALDNEYELTLLKINVTLVWSIKYNAGNNKCDAILLALFDNNYWPKIQSRPALQYR